MRRRTVNRLYAYVGAIAVCAVSVAMQSDLTGGLAIAPPAIGNVGPVAPLMMTVWRKKEVIMHVHRKLASAQYAYVLPPLGTTLIHHYGVGTLQWRLVLSPVQRVQPLRLFGAQMVAALMQVLLHMPVGRLVQA